VAFSTNAHADGGAADAVPCYAVEKCALGIVSFTHGRCRGRAAPYCREEVNMAPNERSARLRAKLSYL
jgi:hypothetical protein